jgi:putative membrane protein
MPEREPVTGTGIPAAASALAVLAAGVLVAWAHPFGMLSAHMALHIALMNVAAPLIAVLFLHRGNASGPGVLWTAAAMQIALLWSFHAPPVQQLVLQSQLLQAAMHVFLFAVALWFWRSLLRLAPSRQWQAIPALLLTGKLVCLLGVLMVFAPRLLYDVPGGHAMHVYGAPSGMADQQFAGLLMVVACPLSYLVAGVIFAVQIIRPDSSQTSRRPFAATGR